MPVSRGTFVQRLIRWRFLFIVNLLIIVFLAISLSREVIRTRAISAEIADLQAQADELAAQNIDLSQLKTAMQTESYIEREARLKLGLKKPGETVVVIQDDSQGVELVQGADGTDPLGLIANGESVSMSVANPTKWWYYFFDKNAFNTLSDYE